MSVFKKLKGTFQNAQQDIVDGLRALTSLDSQSRHEQIRNLHSRDISLDAGADLLYHYQQQWSAIQIDTKESAKKAAEVSAVLGPLFKLWDKRSESMAEFETEVKTIPTILTSLEQIHTQLEALRQDFLVAEKGLDMLENLCEEQEMKNRYEEEQKRLAAYKVHKDAEVERVKVELAHSHAKKMAELEHAKKVNLKERAEAFTSAFQEDVDYYKTHGHTSRMPTDFPKVSSLSQIELEQDKQALDSFLSDTEETDHEPGSLEVSGEAYIEDDYLPHMSPTKEEEDGPNFAVTRDLDTVDMKDYNISACSIDELGDDDDDEDYENDDEARVKRTSKLVQRLEDSVEKESRQKGEKEETTTQGEGAVANGESKSENAAASENQYESNSTNTPGDSNESHSSNPDDQKSTIEHSDNLGSKSSTEETVS